MLAGLEAAKGDYIAVMDVDLQDPPELLPEMYEAIVKEGYDCAATRRVTRKGESPIRSFFAKSFYRFMNSISKTEIVDGARDFRLMTRQMTDAVLSVKEYNRFSKGIFSWVGFSTKWIEYDNLPRAAGYTKWNFWKLFAYAIDGIVGFSTAPLSISSFFGVLFCFFAFLGAVFIVVRWLLFGDPVAGWPSIVCIVLFASGIQLFCISVVGQYLSKTYLESKNRPTYIVKKRSE
jgi:glycosyltransferase involved in cell wall biosynthesis